MKIKYQTRQNETITRDVHVGTKLCGIRVIEFIVENWEESRQLMSERGIQWFKHNINFRVTPEVERKDSNWGSDWVDDGC